jgi:UDP-glucuronate 4-epimerase
MQAGDVKATYADAESLQREIGFAPAMPSEIGLSRFVDGYREFHGV